jgi:putative ABC transport system ATP-binding protein
MATIDVENVSYSYRTKYQTIKALDGVSCGFEEGRMYAIVGPSGSGKTTMLSLLAGLDLPTGGAIRVDGKPMAEIDRDRYRRETASVVYQAFNLFPLLNALENVMYPMRLLGRSKRDAESEAKRLIAEVGLRETILKQRPLMMSGGEQQRVAIARALAAGGSVLLADEPTGNLDTANGETVVRLLKELASGKNYTCIVITHDLEVAGAADEVYRLHDGRIVAN